MLSKSKLQSVFVGIYMVNSPICSNFLNSEVMSQTLSIFSWVTTSIEVTTVLKLSHICLPWRSNTPTILPFSEATTRADRQPKTTVSMMNAFRSMVTLKLTTLLCLLLTFCPLLPWYPINSCACMVAFLLALIPLTRLTLWIDSKRFQWKAPSPTYFGPILPRSMGSDPTTREWWANSSVLMKPTNLSITTSSDVLQGLTKLPCQVTRSNIRKEL